MFASRSSGRFHADVFTVEWELVSLRIPRHTISIVRVKSKQIGMGRGETYLWNYRSCSYLRNSSLCKRIPSPNQSRVREA